jgi:hypothetical protein
MHTESLVEKIKSLPPERITEIEDFVDFIVGRNAAGARHESIAAYAAEHGDAVADIDPALEEAAR